MAAEDQAVDMLFNVVTRLAIAGTEIGLKITGAGARAIGLSFYSLGKIINEKIKAGKYLSPGEKAFTDLVKSGEEIHSIWIDKKYLSNFSQIAKQLGIPFVAIQNGDEIKKGHGFLHKSKDSISFEETYKDKVSISYRASDEVRMAHILEMFDTYNKSETLVENQPEKVEEMKDEVEEFIKENEVKVELPPEVVASEEVKNNQEKVSENDLKKQNKENQSSNLLCFEQFGFEKIPTKAEFDAAYIKYTKEHQINTSESNYITALYEQGCECISKLNEQKNISINPKENKHTESNIHNVSAKPELDECYKFFGFEEKPTVYELREAYDKMVSDMEFSGPNIVNGMYEQACELINKPNEDAIKSCYEFFGFNYKPTKEELNLAFKNYSVNSADVVSPLARNMYENALHYMEKSKSIREILDAKKELHILKESIAEKAVEKVSSRVNDVKITSNK